MKIKNKALIYLVLFLVLVGTFVYFVDVSPDDYYQYATGDAVYDVYIVSDNEVKIPITLGSYGDEWTLVMRDDPASLENIPVYGTLNTRIYDDEAVFITIDPNAGLTGKTTIAALEIDKVIDNEDIYGIPTYSAMTSEYGEYPVITCADANSDYTVIYLTLGEETIVYTQDYCIIVQGVDEDDLIRAADRMVYNLLGIMS